MNTRLRIVKIISRIALGLVWFYEGLVPKILFLRADEIGLVESSQLVWRTPELTLGILGVAQMLVGLWLIIGLAERAAVFIATSWMLILIALVASGDPSLPPDFKKEFKDQPKGKELGEKRGVHLHGNVAINFKRIDNGYFQTTSGVVSATEQDQSGQPPQMFPASGFPKSDCA